MNEIFYIYENIPNDKAFIHQADCSYCNHGMGLTSDKSPYNGKWHGPFNREMARMKIKKLGRSNLRWCNHCARKLKIPRNDI